MTEHVAILGGGLAGTSAAYFLQQGGWSDVRVFEQHTYTGGHAGSFDLGGFVFDEGPHVSFTKNEFVRSLLAESVQGEFIEHTAHLSNYYRGKWLKHPAQCNLYGLPPDLVERCILDIVENNYAKWEDAPRDYADWCYRSLGKTFSEEFTLRYTRKYWTVEAKQMSADWVGQRMYPPKIADVVRGALTPDTDETNHHYLTRFRYPCRGGFGSFTRKLGEAVPVAFGHQLTSVDVRNRELHFANGRVNQYDRLVSSLPLPELIRMMPDAPADVRAAAELLACSSVILISLGVNRADLSPYHWFYVYDEDIPFARVNLTHNLSPQSVPEGCGGIQAEVYFSSYKPLWTTPEKLIRETIASLQQMNILRPEDTILVSNARFIKYANVIFDHQRTPALEIVHGYLSDQNVHWCGRYGEWAYLWTDDAIMSGKRVAETILAGEQVHAT